MTDIDIQSEMARLCTLAAAATPGPYTAEWCLKDDPEHIRTLAKAWENGPRQESFRVECVKPDGRATIAITGCGPTSLENSEFIAACPPQVVAAMAKVVNWTERGSQLTNDIGEATHIRANIGIALDELRAVLAKRSVPA